VYLLLVGERYGYQDAEGISPTEREYNMATSNHAYRIAFFKSVSKREDKEDAFKQKIDRDVIRNVFSSYEELQSGVYASLVEYMTTHLILRQGPFDASVHPDARLEDLDKEKIRRFVSLAREKRQFPLLYSEEDIPHILNSLHLMTDDGKLKNAALLLFAKDVQKWFVSATVKCAHFYGTKMQKPIASLQIYGGSVFEQVDMAVSFVMSRIDQRVGERTHSAEVDVTPELPAQAVTEAIVNAVVHRDYTNTGSV
jgi:predicted HTH transcriptional regulator